MKGMYFVEMAVVEGRERPVAQGRVGAQLNSDHVFVHYDAPRRFGRVLAVAQLTAFALFQTQEDLNEFVNPPPPASVPAGTPVEKTVDGVSESSAD